MEKRWEGFLTWNDEFNKAAKFAEARRPRVTRYIVTAPGMETEWASFGPREHVRFGTEAEAQEHAAKHGTKVYPVCFGVLAPFGSILVGVDGCDIKVITNEEFVTEWDDYTPTAEEQAWITDRTREQADINSLTAKAGRNALLETIDPAAPNGPGAGPATGADPKTD